MCVMACTRSRDKRGNPVPESHWCPDCKREHAAYLDDQGNLADLAIEQRRADLYVPATDQEWRDHLDDVAPLIEDQVIVPASMACPLCNGTTSIVIHTDLVLAGKLDVECPWCGGVGTVPDLPDWHYPDLSERRAG